MISANLIKYKMKTKVVSDRNFCDKINIPVFIMYEWKNGDTGMSLLMSICEK